jgi:RHS repeat-associated protein
MMQHPGSDTRFDNSGRGDLHWLIHPDEKTVTYTRDTEERLVAVTNQRGETFCLHRDLLGRVVEVVDYWGQSRTYRYNPSGFLSETRDAVGNIIKYGSDRVGRLRTKLLPDGSKEEFTYDAGGNLIATSNQHIKIQRVFDAEGKLLEERQGDFKITNTYDLNGNRIRRATSNGNIVTFRYDRLDQVVAICINNDAPIEIQRDAIGQSVSETMGSGLRHQFRYNADGRLIHQQTLANTGQSFHVDYEYDRGGEMGKRSDSRHGVESYFYDPLGRVRQHVNPEGQIQEYLYDPSGDLLRTRDQILNGDRQWYRVAECNDLVCYFDAVGNLIQRDDGGRKASFKWDANDRLICSHNADGTVTTYGYDAQGRRIFKETNGHLTQFHSDGDTLLSEHLPGFKARELVYYPGTFVPLAMIHPDKQSYYYLNDPNGLPRKIVDAVGQVVWSADYTALGQSQNLRIHGIENGLRLQGQYFDEETGLCFNQSRYYDPKAGAFASQDPLGLAAGEKIYSFAPNVWSWIDPLGLSCILANKAQGKAAEQTILNRLLNNPNVKVLGTQIYARTKSGNRIIDILFVNNKTGKMIALEIKSGGARYAGRQVIKDGEIAAGNAVLHGHQATIANVANQGTSGVITSLKRVP